MRRRRAPMTRGLNRNHNRVLKDVFKSAATAATARVLEDEAEVERIFLIIWAQDEY